MTIGEGIPPIGFELAAASHDGPTLVGVQQQPCVQYPVSANAPIVESFRKGVPMTEAGLPVNAVPPFDQAFREEPDLHLPPGEWEFTASKGFAERGCGDDFALQVSIVVRVVSSSESSNESAVPSAEPPMPQATPTAMPAPTSTPRACPGAIADGVLAKDDEGRPILISPDYDPHVQIIWLFPDSVRIESTPILRIMDQDGNVVAIEGDHVTLGGGYGAGDAELHACGVIEREPAQRPPTFDNDPDQVTGVLEGDADLEIGCVWLRDADGVVWEILWRDGYTRDFRDDVAVILYQGQVVATEGDVLTVQGHRPAGAGTWCMRGIVYEADTLEVE